MIYVSTNCLKNPRNVIRVLNEYEKAGFENVELGSIHTFFDIKKLKKFNFNFLIHNYFPPPKNPFNFNLASQKKNIREKSIKLAKTSIDLCAQIESPLYTFHAGFTVDPLQLGKRFHRKNIASRKNSIFIFLESVREISSYAKTRGIKIAMEPNVVQKFNLVSGKNELLLFANYSEIKLFYKFFKKKEVGLLLDLGHTSVTSHWLKFDKNEFVKLCQNKVSAVHVSNNDGLHDQHKSLTQKSWQVSKLKLFKNMPIILETMNLDIPKIKSNIQIAEKAIN